MENKEKKIIAGLSYDQREVKSFMSTKTSKEKCECDNLKNGSIILTDKDGKCRTCGKQYSKPPVEEKNKCGNCSKEKFEIQFNGKDWFCPECFGVYTTPKVATVVEARCEFGVEGCNKISTYNHHKVATSEKEKCADGIKGCNKVRLHTHTTFATSEKETFEERTARKLDEDILSQFTTLNIKTKSTGNGTVKITPTPHESEDWEAEFDNTFGKSDSNGDLFIQTLDESSTASQKIKDFIRKVYQRGREEGQIQLDEVYEETVKKEVLSLAVQEIGKWIDKNSWAEDAGNEVVQVDDLKKFISGLKK